MTDIEHILNKFESVSLADLDKVSLQNRMDAKYIFHSSLLPKILENIRPNMQVLEIDGKRMFHYNTIYFDTPEFQLFKDHHNGYTNRIKVRCREYIESKLRFYEIKQKVFGTRTDKYRQPIEHMFEIEVPRAQLNLIHHHRFQHQTLEYKLTNFFTRITLCNKEMTERVTIDTDLSFQNTLNENKLSNLVIIEVKQNKQNAYSPTIQALKSMMLRQTSFSKYAIGVSLIYPHIKHNNFKPVLLHLKKISAL